MKKALVLGLVALLVIGFAVVISGPAQSEEWVDSGGTVGPPEEGGTVGPPAEGGTVGPPAEGGTVGPPAEGDTIAPGVLPGPPEGVPPGPPEGVPPVGTPTLPPSEDDSDSDTTA